MIGQCKWYDLSKGYGFLTLNNGEKDVFVHKSQLEKAKITTLDPGDKVEFDAEPSRSGRGDQAVNLRLIR